MLILKRRREQSLKIGPDVTIKVVQIDRDAVKLEITAPASFKIVRTVDSGPERHDRPS